MKVLATMVCAAAFLGSSAPSRFDITPRVNSIADHAVFGLFTTLSTRDIRPASNARATSGMQRS